MHTGWLDFPASVDIDGHHCGISLHASETSCQLDPRHCATGRPDALFLSAFSPQRLVVRRTRYYGLGLFDLPCPSTAAANITTTKIAATVSERHTPSMATTAVSGD